MEFKVGDDGVICRAGKHSIGKIRQGRGDLFYFSVKDCKGCKFREGCIGFKGRRRVSLLDCRRLRKEESEASYRERVAVERTAGASKRWYGLGRAKSRGLWRVAVQALMTFFAMDLKVMITRLECAPP